MTKARRAFAVALLLSTGPVAGWAAPCDPSDNPAKHPTFCGIPATPTDVRDAAAFKSAVVATRLAGLRLNSAVAHIPVSVPLGDTDRFAESSRVEATPPPTADGDSSANTAAFEAEARRRLGPRPKPRP